MRGINSNAKNAAVVVDAEGKAAGIISWVNGIQPTKVPRFKMTDDDILARAMYLAKHGEREAGNELLDLYCEGKNVSQ